ncbi:MAG: ABC transporter ATP-binding protein [Phycisphaerales bacterium]|nr:ABC transporter ATP-binding protein [Phycisphaerales bacterium]
MKKIKRLIYYIADYKGSIALYFVCSLLAVIFSLFSMGSLMPVLQVLFLGKERPKPSVHPDFIAQINNYIFDLIDQNGAINALGIICIAIVTFISLKNLFLYISLYILAPIRNAVLRRLRNELFIKILSLPIGYFTDKRKGDIMSKMTNDINEIEVSVISVLEVFIREPLTIAIFLSAMIYISPSLSLFIFIFLPVAGLIIGVVGKSLRKSSNISQQYLAEMLAVIEETLTGMRVVKAFNAERHQQLRFTQMNNNLFRIRNKISARRELASPMSEVMGVTVVSIILWVGGKIVLNHGELTGSTFIGYLTLFTQIINPFKNLSSAYSNLKKGSAALQRIEDILQVEATIKDLPNAKTVLSFEYQIELRHVNFAYGDKVILSDINLTIPKGKTIALVGASGAGKSTLVDLIPRFHDVSSGSILLDGIDLKEYKVDNLRRLIGVVGQDPILFNDTIYNNITLGTGGADLHRVEEAARVASAHDFIQRKAQQYNTEVGDRGSRLSGGERQRITIARAVLKNPPILILDEATSSLDTESERMVQDAINNLMQNRTCIVIAHRLSTVRNADEIIVLDQGKIAERGDHESLLHQQGIYKKLVDMQELK